jgi:methanol--5-hydroxybenzimidazolylcobamide Co-methyltransferase
MGSLGYEVALMNTAIQTGKEKDLRDLYMITDRERGPEGHILAYDNAYEIGKAIVSEGDNYYLRAKAAGLKAAELIKAHNDAKELALTRKQREVLEGIIKDLSALPDDEDKFFEYCCKKYADVPNFDLKNYGL